MIGCDAGSTDPGPGPLATGTCAGALQHSLPQDRRLQPGKLDRRGIFAVSADNLHADRKACRGKSSLSNQAPWMWRELKIEHSR
jgi:hypothetical protein